MREDVELKVLDCGSCLLVSEDLDVLKANIDQSDNLLFPTISMSGSKNILAMSCRIPKVPYRTVAELQLELVVAGRVGFRSGLGLFLLGQDPIPPV